MADEAETMRAWRVHRHGGPRDVLELVDVPVPTPGPGEIRLRVRAAAIGLPDVFMAHGTYPLTPPLPFVAGQEVCGIVDAVGEGVNVAIGERMMAVTSFMDGRGGFAQATIAAADTAFRVPDTMSDADAATFRIGFSTAWIGLKRRGEISPGDWLLVLGAAGGSGITAVQLGRALGARVIAVASGADKLALCQKLGAEVLIDRSTQIVPDEVRAATNGHGADLIYDPVGGDAAAGAMQAIARGGRLLVMGFASGHWAKVDTVEAVLQNISMVGVYAGGYTREENLEDHEALLALAANGSLGGFATVVPFEQLPDALAQVEAGTAIGKIVVGFGDSDA